MNTKSVGDKILRVKKKLILLEDANGSALNLCLNNRFPPADTSLYSQQTKDSLRNTNFPQFLFLIAAANIDSNLSA